MRQRVLWAIAGVLMVTGASWLGVLIWEASKIGGAPYGPHALGGALAGLTLSRVVERRPVVIATLSVAGWFALQTLLVLARGATPFLEGYEDSIWRTLPLAGALQASLAVACASLPLRGRPEHRVLWLWISALVTLGCIVASMVAITNDRTLPEWSVVLLLAAPVIAGGLVQVLAPVRMIWTCGGGMLIMVILALDDTARGELDAGEVVGVLGGLGIFVLLGALGARIAWRVFRHGEPSREANLPTATAHTR
jgi:hypothetical protein